MQTTNTFRLSFSDKSFNILIFFLLMITFQIASQQYRLQLDPNEPVKDTVEAFCLRHQIPHLRNQLLK